VTWPRNDLVIRLICCVGTTNRDLRNGFEHVTTRASAMPCKPITGSVPRTWVRRSQRRMLESAHCCSHETPPPAGTAQLNHYSFAAFLKFESRDVRHHGQKRDGVACPEQAQPSGMTRKASRGSQPVP
jgi:hypothetical protein